MNKITFLMDFRFEKPDKLESTFSNVSGQS